MERQRDRQFLLLFSYYLEIETRQKVIFIVLMNVFLTLWNKKWKGNHFEKCCETFSVCDWGM
jgi:hypothetical protein